MTSSVAFSCVICHDSFVVESVVSVTNCGHIYHTDCLNEWVTRENKCPICNSRDPNYREIYPTFLSNQSTERNNEVSIAPGAVVEDNDEDTALHNEVDLAINVSLQARIDELETKLAAARLH